MSRLTPLRIAPVIAGLILAGACGDGPTGPVLVEELPRPLTDVEAAVVSASNDFAFRLLDQVRQDGQAGENLFLSPLSVSMALGMAANGAAGETLVGIKATLGVPHLSRDQMNAAYRGLLDLLLPLDPRVDLGVANSAWARAGIPFHADFTSRIQAAFDAEARTLDFSDPGTKDVINAWVRDHTGGRIEEIVEQIEPEHILFLINATYFDGSWSTRFEAGETRTAPFLLEDGSTTSLPLMSAEAMPGAFHLGGDVAVADLPYGGQVFSMTLVVPQHGDLSSLLEGLTAERWATWMRGLRTDTIPVRLPRFEMESKVVLNDALSRMGMASAFTTLADFSDLTPLPALISKVNHKTYLSVDEEGTEAAAATSVEISLTSAPASFTADRPFLVAIRERLTGTLLFLGAVYDPS